MRVAALVVLACLAGCTVGPDYVRPDTKAPPAYKELPPAKAAQPADDLPRTRWWTVYGDPVLDELEDALVAANPNLRVAEANYRNAQAALRVAQSQLLPGVGLNAGASRGRQGVSGTRTSVNAALDASWEVDLWGGIRRAVEASTDSAQAAAATLESTRLSLATQLAQAYVQLRVLDRQRKLLDETVAGYERSLALTQNRYDAGVVARADVVTAQTQLQSAQVQAVDVRVTRAQLEHAIAALTGRAPAEYSLARTDATPALPAIPAGLPSELLERRPDVAAAERRVAAANAQVGVATAALYPSLTLSAAGGFAGSSFSNWISLPNRLWSLGAALAAPVFDAGLRTAQRDEAIAAYDAAVANYRATVLAAFQDVEDSLAELAILDAEAVVQKDALASARRSVELATNQYKAGLVNYINVVAQQTIAYAAERNALDLEGRRLVASVALVKAIGGGWRASDLPDRAALATPAAAPR